SNLKTFCKYCINALGEEEGKNTYFPNKKDQIILHLKKCLHFLDATIAKEQAEIFKLISDNNSSTKKRYSSRKIVVRSKPYGPIDNYAVQALSKEDAKQFNKLLLRMTVSYVIDKTELMLLELESINIKVCTIITNSAGAYAAT
ncbi:7_t:CDS:2, partial [Scutellospora calospora]